MDELYVGVEDALSEEFHTRFNPSTLALTIALLVCLASGLVALAFLMAAQVQTEQRRQMLVHIHMHKHMRMRMRMRMHRCVPSGGGR